MDAANEIRTSAMDRTCGFYMSGLAVLAYLLVVTLGSGCASLLATVGYAMGMNVIPPDSPALQNSKVAVVVVAGSTAGKASIDAPAIAAQIEQRLRAKVPGITLVSQQEIDGWKDTNDWDQYDFRQIGRGVKADKVLAVNIKSYRTHASQAVFKGTAEIDLDVYDMTDSGKQVFHVSPTAVEFPRVGVLSTTDISENDFRRKFTAYLADQSARFFVSREPQEDVVPDLQYLAD
jgi:hypothetical protein